MLKKLFVLVFVMLVVSLPVFAVKQKHQEILKVVITDVDNAVTYKIKPESSAVTVAFLSNLDCKEYNLQRTYRTINGIRYIMPVGIWQFINEKPMVYARNLIKQYKGDIYFKPLGIGINGYYVGEMYLGHDSLNKHLVEKGYCNYIK